MIEQLKTDLLDIDSTMLVRFQNAETISVDFKSNAKTYGVISDILHRFGEKDKGLCGGGFEHYPLINGMVLAVKWGDDLDSIYLGTMGKGF